MKQKSTFLSACLLAGILAFAGTAQSATLAQIQGFVNGPQSITDHVLLESYLGDDEGAAIQVYEIAPAYMQWQTLSPELTGGSTITLSAGEVDSLYAPEETISYSKLMILIAYDETSTAGDNAFFEGPLIVDVVGALTQSWGSVYNLATFNLYGEKTVSAGSPSSRGWVIDISDYATLPYTSVRVRNAGSEDLSTFSVNIVGRP